MGKKDKKSKEPQPLVAVKNVSSEGWVIRSSQAFGLEVGHIAFVEKDHAEALINRTYPKHVELVDIADYSYAPQRKGYCFDPNIPREEQVEIRTEPRIPAPSSGLIERIQTVAAKIGDLKKVETPEEPAKAEAEKPKRGQGRRKK